MARTSSLGFQHVDSTRSEKVLDRLRKNKVDQLTISSIPFPTTKREFQEAVVANTSVTVLKFAVAPDTLEKGLKSKENLNDYLTILGSGLRGLESIIFHGVWKDVYLTTFLQALKISCGRTKYSLQFWCLGAGWKATSSSALAKLIQTIKTLRFQSIDLSRIIQEPADLTGLFNLLSAFALQSESIRVPMVTGESPSDEGIIMGEVPVQCLRHLLYNQSTSPLRNLRVGYFYAFGERCQIAQLNSLQPFDRDEQSCLEELDLIVSQKVTNFLPLLSFCRRSPRLTRVNVSIVLPNKNRFKTVDISELHPNIADAISRQISLHKADGAEPTSVGED